jgi:hypothetical protein
MWQPLPTCRSVGGRGGGCKRNPIKGGETKGDVVIKHLSMHQLWKGAGRGLRVLIDIL